MFVFYTICKDLNALQQNGDDIMKLTYNEPHSTMDKW